MSQITLTTTPIDDIQVGDLLLDYDGHGEDAGTAGTYDEQGLDDLMRRLDSRITLPEGWRLATRHDYGGCMLIAQDQETGREVTDISEAI